MRGRAVAAATARLLAAALLLGGAPGGPADAQVTTSGAVNTVGQRVLRGRVDPTQPGAETRDEATASFDLFVDVTWGALTLHAYVEAATTPVRGGVSQRWPAANTDARTALGADGRGRLQLSELKLVVGDGALRAGMGLLDATGYLDVSRIANDENLFFLGAPFVNNPSIEFPDYVPGLAVEWEDRGLRPGIKAVLTGSHGLADVPGASYREVLRLGAEGRGVFAGVAAGWERGRYRLTLGGWTRTSPRPRLDGVPGTVGNRGAYGVGGVTLGRHTVSLRAGAARGVAALAARFVGVTWLLDASPSAVGLGTGWTAPAGSVMPARPATVHGEIFLRFDLFRGIFLTASAQALHHADFRDDGAAAVLVGGRLSYAF